MAPTAQRRSSYSRKAQYNLFTGYIAASVGALIGAVLLGLSFFLEQKLKRPVVDRTGPTQNFNIDLRWDARDPDQAEAIKEALMNRLGLELAPSRERVEMLVMERAD